jgi:outer membrane protein OmpA-like peptidoglycan-associated protein/phosphodiesterase/alkaline phosphatase D-like protein
MKKTFTGASRFFLSLLLTVSTLGIISSPSAHASVITLGATDELKFDQSNVANYTNISGNGTGNGDIVLYKNVVTVGGISVDCAVKTTIDTAEATIAKYDNPGSATTAGTPNNNFMIDMNTTSSKVVAGGTVSFEFSFFEAGTYSGVGTGIPIVLKNVRMSSIDLDSSTATGSYQFTDFTGFQGYSLMNPTNLAVQPLTNPVRVRFIATKTGNRTDVPEDRVLVRYDAISAVSLTFGNVMDSAQNFFGLTFGGWPAGSTPVTYTNGYNQPPSSTDTTLNVAASTTTLIPLSAFGTYTDPDNNPFMQVRITALPSLGTIQYFNGLAWVNVALNDVIQVADIQNGSLRYDGTLNTATNVTLKFLVNDGLDYSDTENTISLVVAGTAQTITFANPGTKAPSATPFASSATTNATGLTITLTSNTPGVCTVSGLNITATAGGSCSITATQPGGKNSSNVTYAAANPVTQVFPVSSLTAQSITFANPNAKTFSTSPFNIAPTASSGLTVTVTSLTPSVCTVVAGPPIAVTMVTTGTCTLQASQAGSVTVAPAANVTQSFVISAAAPTATTNAATSIGSTGGTINGSVNGSGAATTITFCYSLAATVSGSALQNCIGGAIAGSPGSTSGSSAISTSAVLTGLTTNTTYYFQVIATAGGSSVYGSVLNFTPNSSGPPVATTYSPTRGSSSTAKFNGAITVSGSLSTTVKFNYCTSPTTLPVYSSTAAMTCGTTTVTSVNASTSAITSSTTFASPSTYTLTTSSNTIYYYQIYATNSAGASYGQIIKVRASTGYAVTNAATGVASSGTATLNGSGTRSSSGTTTYLTFCYSKTSAVLYGALSGCISPAPIASPASTTSSSGTAFSSALTGLAAGTYYFQAAAYVTSSGTTYTNYGEVLSFTITGNLPPVAITNDVTSLSGTSATLNGSVSANTANATVTFCYKMNSSAVDVNGALTSCTSATPTTVSSVTATNSGSPTLNLTSLQPGTTYYYQVIATSTYGTSYGSVLNFSISSLPTVNTYAATAVKTTTATLNGDVNANGTATTSNIFCFSTASTLVGSALGNCATTVAASPATVTGSSVTTLTGYATGLTPGTRYYFQARATNSSGTVYGPVLNFIPGAPVATTTLATSVTGSSATLNGAVNANGASTTSTFCYKANNSDVDANGALTSCTSVSITGTLSTKVAAGVTATITGLTGGATYYYQTIANNAGGTSYGNLQSFVAASAPGATTLTASSITSNSATISGTINPNGANTNNYFCWSILSASVDGLLNECSTNPFSTPTTSSTATGNTVVTPTLSLTGLRPGTAYYYQVLGDNSAGTVFGSILTFTTAPAAPEVVTQDPVVSASSATLNGTVNAWGADAAVSFCYKTSSNAVVNRLLTSCTSVSATPNTATGVAPVSSTGTISGLTAGTTYYYQIIGSNSVGTTYGDVLSFIAGAPTVITNAATSITGGTAVLNGNVNPNSSAVSTISFCLATDPTLTAGALSGCTNPTPSKTTLLSTDGATGVSANATSLTAGSTYYYQIIAQNGRGTSYGNVVTFDAGSPTASTVDASSITSTTAQLNGSVTPASGTSSVTKIGFCYSTSNASTAGVLNICDTAYDGTPSVTTTLTTNSSLSLFNLTPQTTYYFQITGLDVDGSASAFGTIKSFMTLAAPITVHTNPATSVGVTTATLRGDASAALSSPKFCFSTTDPGDSFNTSTCTTVNATGSYGSYSFAKTGLTQQTIYFFQLFGTDTNLNTTVKGLVQQFSTIVPGAPSVTTNNVSSLGTTNVDLSGVVNANEVTTTITICWGTSPTDVSGALTTCTVITPSPSTASGNSSTNTSYSLTGLTPGTTYYYQVIGVSTGGTTNGNIVSFTTATPPSSGGNRAPLAPVTPTPTPVAPTAPKKEAPIKTANQGLIQNTKTAVVQTFANSYPTGINKIVPVLQTVTSPLTATEKVIDVIVNGKTTEVNTPGNAIKLPLIVGPKDLVSLVVSEGGVTKEVSVAYTSRPISLANVNFNLGSAGLTPNAIAILNNVIKVVQDHGFTYLDLSGHTDVQGGTTFNNQKLSEARAAQVKAYLQQQLGSGVTVVTSAHAYAQPAVKASNAIAFATNRRVEVVVK